MSGPMRCDDVTRALAVPTAGRDASALAEHLAACPACSDFAGRLGQLDRLWQATRPVEPSDAAWETLWSGVCDRLDQPAAVEAGVGIEDEAGRDLIALPVAASRSWRRRLTAVFGLAQAAALLVCFGLLLARPPQEVRGAGVVDIEPGEVVFIDGNGQVHRTAATDADAGPSDVDDNFAMFNALEAMAKDL
jgi:hypothetical protein